MNHKQSWLLNQRLGIFMKFSLSLGFPDSWSSEGSFYSSRLFIYLFILLHRLLPDAVIDPTANIPKLQSLMLIQRSWMSELVAYWQPM